MRSKKKTMKKKAPANKNMPAFLKKKAGMRKKK